MPASRRALTAAQVAAITEDGVTWVAPSLYVQVREQGTRSYLFRPCLAHAVGDAAELAYKRSDFLERRRAVMQGWAEFGFTSNVR